MYDIGDTDRDKLLELTEDLSLERKAELIFLYCVKNEEILGDDIWHVPEIAALYGIHPRGGNLRNCYPDVYTYREIFNLMYTYPEGFEDRDIRFENVILDVNLNRALHYFGRDKNNSIQIKLDEKYEKYDNYDEEEEPVIKTNKEIIENEGYDTNRFNRKFGIVSAVLGLAYMTWVIWRKPYYTLDSPPPFIEKILEIGCIAFFAATIIFIVLLIIRKNLKRNIFFIFGLAFTSLTLIQLYQRKLINFIIGIIFTVWTFRQTQK